MEWVVFTVGDYQGSKGKMGQRSCLYHLDNPERAGDGGEAVPQNYAILPAP